MVTGALSFRKPDKTWMLTAGIAALCLHGLLWFVAGTLYGNADALAETQRQMVLAVFWIVCAVILWKIAVPASRLHAAMGVLTCALFVTVLGSVAALVKLWLVDHAALTKDLLTSFGLLSGVMGLVQMAIAVPTAFVLQGMTLTRKAS